MVRLKWSEVSQRRFTTGVDRGVLYLQNGTGVAWNGLLSVVETPTDSGVLEGFQDGEKKFSRRLPESYAFTVEAYTYPIEFEPFLGNVGIITGQANKEFGFSFRTSSRFAEDGSEAGNHIHLVYNAQLITDEKTHNTINDTSDITKLSWQGVTTAQSFGDARGSHLIIDTEKISSSVLENLEKIIYGSEGDAARLPQPQELLDLFEAGSILVITDNGDGTWSAEGPDEIIDMLSSTIFEIDWQSAVYLDGQEYIISSL